MKLLFKKLNLLFVLFMMCCSIPLFMACGDDDPDPNNPDNPDIPGTGTYLGWEDDGNTATFGYKVSAGGVSVSAIIRLTFDGPGKTAKCTKSVIEETYPSDKYAEMAEGSYKQFPDEYRNLKRNGKTVSYEDDSFIGDTREEIKRIVETAYSGLS